jgi:hypothetical protein
VARGGLEGGGRPLFSYVFLSATACHVVCDLTLVVVRRLVLVLLEAIEARCGTVGIVPHGSVNKMFTLTSSPLPYGLGSGVYVVPFCFLVSLGKKPPL